MKYKDTDFKALHLNPIWRDKANFVFTSYLGSKNGFNEWEQIWGQQTSSNTFIVCCIPCFAINVSLGDEVETDADFIIKKIIKKGSQTTFRIWLKGQKDTFIKGLIDDLINLKALIEPYSKNLIAISVNSGVEAQIIANYLQKKFDENDLQYETGTQLDGRVKYFDNVVY
jgi:hypothetical protein